MEQMSIGFIERPDEEVIREALVQEINNTDFTKHLVVEVLKSGIISIKAFSNVCVRVKLTHNVRYIEVRTEDLDEFKEYFSTDAFEVTDKEWSRIAVNTVDDVLAYIKPISMLFILMLTKEGAGFGCCSRYVKCSDEKKCIHPDFLTSLACAYKRNLEAGRIFYGKNRNVD